MADREPEHASADALVDVLLDRVRQAAREVERTAVASAHAAAFAKDVFEHRSEYLGALSTLEQIDEHDLHELFLAEIDRAYMRDPERLTRNGRRSDLLVEWLEVLLEAVAEVQLTLERANHFGAAGPPTEEDVQFRAAARRRNADRLRRAS